MARGSDNAVRRASCFPQMHADGIRWTVAGLVVCWIIDAVRGGTSSTPGRHDAAQFNDLRRRLKLASGRIVCNALLVSSC
jgi:hypothetical protein